MRLAFIVSGVAVAVVGVLLWSDRDVGEDDSSSSTTANAFVGRVRCATCHPAEHDNWRGSHHDLAMQEVAEDTVLGDFTAPPHDHFGDETRFVKRDGRHLVETAGADGAVREHVVRYVFGVDPLQQLLLEAPGGRLQALGVAWDARPAADGGQRWYHLYPDERIPAGDELHWSGPNQNWNFMCAECHSTGLRRGYDAKSDTFSTTWAEIDVSCEACHGPGRRHVAWAEAGGTAVDADKGLAANVVVRSGDDWRFEPGQPTATRVRPLPHTGQMDGCARCHSRRGVITDHYVHGEPFLDHYRPSFLEERLYHADGQILDEVYVWGSFQQSRMHAKGVVCTDCHDRHTARVLANDNSLCNRCHSPEVFDVPAHHHHAPGSKGAECVACHMPSRHYMVVDPRRDHSLRVPRPDLTVKLGTPNACDDCHADKGARWAADAVASWRGGEPLPEHFATVLDAGRRRTPGAGAGLARLAADAEQAAIVRGTALAMLARHPGDVTGEAVRRSLRDPEALVRLGAAAALEGVAPEARPIGLPLLGDARRAVRIEAARHLAMIASRITGPDRSALDAAISEYEASQHANGDRAWAHVNLAGLYVDLGRLDDAEAEYRHALRLDPRSLQTRVNLADLLRLRRDDTGAVALLDETVKLHPSAAAAHHALGLALVRVGRTTDAVAALAEAARLAPEDARYGYVHAVALDSTGDREGALRLLEVLLRKHPRDTDILMALATMNRDLERFGIALGYAETLAGLLPGDPAVARLVEELRRR